METTFDTPKTISKPGEKRLSRRALLEVLDDRATIQQFLQHQPYTCIVLTSWYNDKEYMGYGFSKVCYPDKWDGELGADIAKKRALYMVYHQVRANERIQPKEEVLSTNWGNR